MKNNKFLKLIGLFILSTIFTSCISYTIPIDSFKKQFSGIDSSSLKNVIMRGTNLMLVSVKYKANPIDSVRMIKVQDGKKKFSYTSE